VVGNIGMYFAAYRLSLLGWNVMPTSRNARGIDLLAYDADSLRIKMQRRVDESDPYFQMVHTQWGEGLRRVFAQLPDPDW